MPGQCRAVPCRAPFQPRVQVAQHVYAMIVPGSGLVKQQAEAEGLDAIFIAAVRCMAAPGTAGTAAWLHGCMAAPLHGCMAAWLHRWHRCMAASGFVERRLVRSVRTALVAFACCIIRRCMLRRGVLPCCSTLSPLQRPCYAGCNAACWRGIAIGSAAVAGVRLARGGLLNVPWHEPRPAVDRCAARTQPVYASYHGTCRMGYACSSAAGERCASTSNRNFEGRQGAGGRTHLVGPTVLTRCIAAHPSHRPRAHEGRACFSAHSVEGGPHR